MDESAGRRSIRHDCMHWAVLLALPGEDPLKVLARAELFEDYLTAPLNGGLNLEKAVIDKG